MSQKQFSVLLVIVFTAHRVFANGAVEPPDEIIDGIEGDTISLSCKSKIPLNFFESAWFKWVDNEWKNVLEIDKNVYLFVQNGYLSIESLHTNNTGVYLCEYTSDPFLGVRKNMISLIVRKRTNASIQHDEPIVGKRVAIRCNMIADPSLTYKIEWKLNNTKINFKDESHLMKEGDYGIIIQNAELNDTGVYSCIVSTYCKGMPDAVAETWLIVRGVPNAPRITKTICNPHNLNGDGSHALIEWESNGDNGATIEGYTIEYNVNFKPGIWTPLDFVDLPKSRLEFVAPMTEYRYANYTFRVIAKNEVGSSTPSEPSEMCTSEADMPYGNPKNVKVVCTEPGNMVVSWEPMPVSVHNGPGFHYLIRWRPFEKDQRNRDDEWNEINVTDWMQNNVTIYDLPVFVKYEINVKSNGYFKLQLMSFSAVMISKMQS